MALFFDCISIGILEYKEILLNPFNNISDYFCVIASTLLLAFEFDFMKEKTKENISIISSMKKTLKRENKTIIK